MDGRFVRVQPVPRKGHNAFFRGGQRWPNEGRVALVTPRLLAVLKAEPQLRVDTEVDSYDLEEDLPLLDIPAPTHVDPIAQAMEEKAKLDREKAALKAQLELESARKEIEELRKQLAAKTKADLPSETKKKA
jgi:hypothetical protein